jgi:hypothetical protein
MQFPCSVSPLRNYGTKLQYFANIDIQDSYRLFRFYLPVTEANCFDEL